MKGALFVIVALFFVQGLTEKKILLVGPEAPTLILKYCTGPSAGITPLNSYTCAINEEQVTILSAPVFQGIGELDYTLHYINNALPLNLVIFLWPASPTESFDPYVPVAMAFLTHIRFNQRPFVILAPTEGYQDLQNLIGVTKIATSGHSWEYLQAFETLVKDIDTNVFVSYHDDDCTHGKKSGCLASINVLETRDGQKLIKDVAVGDEVLTPNGFMPVIYVEDHPNTTFPCVNVGGVWLTEDHFIYTTDNSMVAAGEVANTSMQVHLEARTVVVKGDSFFCNERVLVSSYSRFRWLPSFSFIIDRMPTRMIALCRQITSVFL